MGPKDVIIRTSLSVQCSVFQVDISSFRLACHDVLS